MNTKCNPFKAQYSSMTVFRIELSLLQLQRSQFAASASVCSWEEKITLTVGASLHRSKAYVLQPIYIPSSAFGHFSEEFSLLLGATATGQPYNLHTYRSPLVRVVCRAQCVCVPGSRTFPQVRHKVS